MALVDWKDSYSVKIDEIDSQHKMLFEYLNRLYAILLTDKTSLEKVRPILEGLISYTKSHFQTEEAYFKKYGYPDAILHLREHEAFINRVEVFRQEFNAGKVSLTIEVMKFIKKWLEEHIRGSDQKYSLFLKKKGV